MAPGGWLGVPVCGRAPVTSRGQGGAPAGVARGRTTLTPVRSGAESGQDPGAAPRIGLLGTQAVTVTKAHDGGRARPFRFAGHLFAPPVGGHGALRPQPAGLNHIIDRAKGVMPIFELAGWLCPNRFTRGLGSGRGIGSRRHADRRYGVNADVLRWMACGGSAGTGGGCCRWAPDRGGFVAECGCSSR